MVSAVKIRETGGGALTLGVLMLAAVWLFLPRTYKCLLHPYMLGKVIVKH
jgi:hypothetical protein